MAVNKKVLVLVVVVIAVIQSVAVGFAFWELAQKDYSIEGDIVYAYFKTYNASEGVEGIGNRNLVSYVLVLNITNPNDEPITLKSVLVELTENATQTGTSVSSTNGMIRYKDYLFPYGSNYISPQSSTFAAFTATGELSNMALDALKLGKGYFIVNVQGYSKEDQYFGNGINLKEVTLEITDNNEYVFNTAFRDNYRFHFRNDGINISYEW